MRVWLVNPGEPLPSDSKGARLQRTGQLAEALVARGHEVVYWSGNFNHFTRRNRFPSETVVQHDERYQLRLLRGPSYSKSVSLRRIAHHYRVARRFLRCAGELPSPDLIYASVGPIETSVAAARFALPRGIPLVLDVRDLWPDMYLDAVPRWTRGPARLALWPMDRGIRYACRSATAIIGTGPRFLDWGLAKAGRPQGPLDRHFPQACDSEAPTADLLEGAREFWRRHGIEGSGGALTACFFGAIGKNAEIPTVIEAARRLRNDGRSIRFVLCGAGDLLARCRQMAEGLDNVILSGWVGFPEIWTLMQMSSVGLAPYAAVRNYLDNLTTKPIVYISVGLPVIVTRSTRAVCELVDENECGAVYENENAEQLARQLAVLDDDRERLAGLSRRAKALYESQFTTEKVFGPMVDHLERIKDSQPANSQSGSRQANPIGAIPLGSQETVVDLTRRQDS